MMATCRCRAGYEDSNQRLARGSPVLSNSPAVQQAAGPGSPACRDDGALAGPARQARPDGHWPGPVRRH
eukprot:194910-Hanusia_phi.AAC.1